METERRFSAQEEIVRHRSEDIAPVSPFRRVVWPAIFAIAAVSCSRPFRADAAAASASPVFAITDVTVVDVEQGRTIGPRTVLIQDGRVMAIEGPAESHAPDDAQRVDGRGRFLIPGLVDMHVHLFNNASHRPPNTWAFPLFVANGITAVREMAAIPASMPLVRAWRKEAGDGTLVVPRILAAGVVAYGPSPDEAVRQVDAAADAGADFIKVFSDISASNWRAVIDASHRRSLPVMGHVPADVSVLAAAQAGQRSDEHLTQIFEACSTIERAVFDERHSLEGEALIARSDAEEPRVLDAYDQRTCDHVAAALVTSGQAQVPTLILPYVESKPASREQANDARWQYLRADERARWLRIQENLTAEERAVAARRWPVARKIVTTLHHAGAVLLAGTDTPMPGVYPGYSLHEELALLVESGLSPAEALRSATLAPASFLGIADRLGSVSIGKRADLVLLDANPLIDIRNTRGIRAVILDGRLLTRPALDALLADAAKAVAD